jgi:hypothetical protein
VDTTTIGTVAIWAFLLAAFAARVVAPGKRVAETLLPF